MLSHINLVSAAEAAHAQVCYSYCGGLLIEEYYQENARHDVIFIGDCEVYGNISPVTLWEKYGTSYIRGSAQQLIWQSYYLMEETSNTKSPKFSYSMCLP